MNTFTHVPPGFRFHPTEEELVDYYLRKKILSRKIDLDVIKDIDLYKIEPWDIQDMCSLGTEEENEWYFFSHKDKKYPTGTRTNRATTAGFWKATGRDKAIYSKLDLIGMRKTLVFYKGRAPNGLKSDWIMHEYRIETNEHGTPQEEGWVVCRVFKKKMTAIRKASEHEWSCWYDDQLALISDLDSPKQINKSASSSSFFLPFPCKKELDLQNYQIPNEQQQYFNLPLLQTPKPLDHLNPFGLNMNSTTTLIQETRNEQNLNEIFETSSDWRVLDKFVATQLSQVDASKQSNYSNPENVQVCSSSHHKNAVLISSSSNGAMVMENAASTSGGSSCEIDLWK